MALTLWILLGLSAGFVANWLARKRGFGLGYDALLGMAGATLAGFGVDALAASPSATMSPWSLVASLCGAGLVLAVSASIEQSSKRASARPTPRPKRVVRR